jgi:hypothetical protein
MAGAPVFKFNFAGRHGSTGSTSEAMGSSGTAAGGGGPGALTPPVSAVPTSPVALVPFTSSAPASFRTVEVLGAAGTPIIRKCLASELPPSSLTPIVTRTDLEPGVYEGGFKV